MNTVVSISGILSALISVWSFSPHGKRFMIRNFQHGRKLARYSAVTAVIITLGTVLSIFAFPNMAIFALVTVTATVGLCAGLFLISLTLRIDTLAVQNPRRFLIVAAHPDDIELACGGTLAKLSDEGHELHGLIMTNGAKGGDASRRVGEAERGADFLKLTSLTTAHLPDLDLENHTCDMIDVIEEHFSRIHPDVILTHSHNDYHQDHVAVHQAVMRASRSHHSVLCFESPSVTADFNPRVFVDVGQYSDVKVEAINFHKDQIGKSYLDANVVNGIGAFRGRQARLGSAEGFEVVRFAVNGGFSL